MYGVLILFFIFWFVNIYPKCAYKRHLISKFQVLHEESRDIASFVEHAVSSNFKMYSVPILVFYFSLLQFIQSAFSTFLEISDAPRRKQFRCFFVEHHVCSNFKMYSVLILVFWFYFPTFNPKCICKSRLFLNFQVLQEGSSFIASFVEHTLCSNFKIYIVLILVFLFWLVNIYPKIDKIEEDFLR